MAPSGFLSRLLVVSIALLLAAHVGCQTGAHKEPEESKSGYAILRANDNSERPAPSRSSRKLGSAAVASAVAAGETSARHQSYAQHFHHHLYKQDAIPFNDDFIVIEANPSGVNGYSSGQDDLGDFEHGEYDSQAESEPNEGLGSHQNIFGKNSSHPVHANNHGTHLISDLNLDKKETEEKDTSHSDRDFYAKLAKNISFIISPILLVLGGIGNPLCIIVLTRKNKNPTIIYLCVLAAFDILVLYSGLLRNYLNELFNYDISSYILVAVTFNRFTIMFNRTIFCKPKMLKRTTQQKPESLKGVVIIVTTITIIVSLMNLHFLIFYENVATPAPAAPAPPTTSIAETTTTRSAAAATTVLDALLISSANRLSDEATKAAAAAAATEAPKVIVTRNKCTISRVNYPQYFDFRVKIFPKLHLYLFIVLPCCVLFIMNLLIIRKIMISSAGSMIGRGHATENSTKSKDAKKKEKKRTALSIMLVSVCLWFMILKTPASLYLTFPEDEETKPHFPLTYNIFMLINYTNHAVNLILYIAISSSFREEFKDYFVAIRKKIFKTKRHHHHAHPSNNQPSYSCTKSNCNVSVANQENNNNNNKPAAKERPSNLAVAL